VPWWRYSSSVRSGCVAGLPVAATPPRSGQPFVPRFAPLRGYSFGAMRLRHDPYDEWPDGVSDTLACRVCGFGTLVSSPLRRHARACWGSLGFASLSMPRGMEATQDGCPEHLSHSSSKNVVAMFSDLIRFINQTKPSSSISLSCREIQISGPPFSCSDPQIWIYGKAPPKRPRTICVQCRSGDTVDGRIL